VTTRFPGAIEADFKHSAIRLSTISTKSFLNCQSISRTRLNGKPLPRSMTIRISLYFTCLVWSLASTMGFLVIPAAFSCHQNHWLTAGSCIGGLTTRGLLGHRRSKGESSNLFMISSAGDDGGKSFGEEAMRERTNAELQEIVSKHKILAFIKVIQTCRPRLTDNEHNSQLLGQSRLRTTIGTGSCNVYTQRYVRPTGAAATWCVLVSPGQSARLAVLRR